MWSDEEDPAIVAKGTTRGVALIRARHLKGSDATISGRCYDCPMAAAAASSISTASGSTTIPSLFSSSSSIGSFAAYDKRRFANGIAGECYCCQRVTDFWLRRVCWVGRELNINFSMALGVAPVSKRSEAERLDFFF